MSASLSEAAAGRPPVSVIVCAYTQQRWDDLVAAVGSVVPQLRQEPSGDEVVVVIDHNDDLFEAARRQWQREPRVTVVRNQRARGLSGARNTGVDAARTDLIVFLDDDALAEPGLLDRLVEGLTEDDVLGVGGAPEPAWPGERKPGWLPDELNWVVGCRYTGLPTTPSDVRNPIGAVMGFHRRVFDLVGPFNEQVGRVGSVPLGCEETELAVRLRQSAPHARIVFLPEAVARHRVTGERATWKYLVRRGFAEGVSKAVVAREVGAGDALSSERAYVGRTLPRAVARELRRAARGDREGLLAVAAIGACLTSTGAGYLRGMLTRNVIEPGLKRQARVIDLRPDAPGPGSRRTMDVVICTYQRPDAAARCVASVRAAQWSPERGPRPRIFLVDNAPQDVETAQRLWDLAARHDDVVYVPAPRRGASAARNRGVMASSAELIAFTDDDAEVDPGWLEKLADGFTDTSVMAVTGLVRPRALRTEAQNYFEQFGGFGKGTTARVFDAGSLRDDPLYPYAAGVFGSGNNVAFRRDWLVAEGGYDEALGPGTPTRAGEDLDLFIRVIAGGHRLSYQPAAVVHHEHRETLDDLRHQVHGYGRGLVAMLLAQIERDPRTLLEIARRVPAGVHHLLGDSSKNENRVADYPMYLIRAELSGMLVGMVAYVGSRARRRRAYRLHDEALDWDSNPHRLALPVPGKADSTASRVMSVE